MKHVVRWCLNAALILLGWHLVSTGLTGPGAVVGILGALCALSDTWELIR